MNDTSGCAKNVHYGDILVKFGESISAEKADLPFICDREILKKLSKSILKNGDVVIADTAEDMTTGKSCEIVDVDECMPVLAGLHTIPVRPKQKFGKYYLGYYLNSEAFHSQLIPLIQGIKVYSISKSSIKDTVVMFPDDVQEQEKIGSLFNRIDNTITLQQRKLNSLQKLKKGLLQKMFPKNGENITEIRFPEFSDAWKQRKFSEVFEEYSEKKHPELPALTIIQGKGTILRDASDRNLLYDKANLTSYKLVRKDDFIVHLRTFEGGLEKANSDGIVSPAYHIFHGKNTDTRFFYPFFRSKYFIDALLKPHVYGIRDGKSIDIEGMKTISFLVPSFEEQNKIGKFVETLDNTITLQQRKLESLQKLKKGLLQQMFI